MTRTRWAALLVLPLLVAACRPAPAVRAGTVRIELSPIPDVGDMPRLMAIDAMRGRGYTVETLSFADTTGTVLALERGDLDFANVADASAWTAIERGVPIVAVLDDTANPNILVARKDITRCADLHHKRVAIQNLSGSNTIVLHRYIEMRCPDTKPNYLVMAGGPTRMAGLLAGELDAAIMHVEDLDTIDGRRRGEVAPLIVFADEFPGLTTLSHVTRRDVIAKRPEIVKDWLRALLEARRRLQDPRVLADELSRRLKMAPDLARDTAAKHLARHFWDVNGRLTSELVQQNIDFTSSAEGHQVGIKASDVADLTPLNAVLAEIGRQ